MSNYMTTTLKQKWIDIHSRYTQPEMRYIMKNVISLIDRKLSQVEINVLADDCNDVFTEVALSQFTIMFIEVNDILDEMLEDCIELELYDFCSNIRDFKKCIN